MLVRNFFREIFSTLPRLMSVIIVTAIGVFMYVGMSGITYNLTLVADSYYGGQNVADFWISGKNLTKLEEKEVSRLEGVATAQARVVVEAQPVRDKDVTVNLYAVSGDYIINKPYIVAGRLPETEREFALFDEFAKAHNLSIGDTYELKIKDTPQKITLTVCGYIRSPEIIYNVSGIDMIPNSYKLGFAYMKAESLQDLMGKNIFNQICVKLYNNTDEAQEKFKRDVDEALGEKAASILSFKDNTRAYMLRGGIKEMKTTTTSLPILFFLISALIMFTTMSRIIEEARMQIGILKALGYSDFSIFIYYISYAQVVVILGVLLGVLPSGIITNLLISIYKATFSMPDFTAQFSAAAIIQVLIITNIFCTGTSVYICIKGLRDMPAECIRPKIPKTGNKNIIERMSVIWKRLTFTEKTIIRNIFRNKMRLVMCVAGVAGCMTVVTMAFGMNDSNYKFFDMLFEKIHRYDLQVFLKADTTEAQYRRIQSTQGITKCEYQMDVPSTFSFKGKKEGSVIAVVEDEISLMLLDINSDTSMKLPRDGAVVSSVLAKKLNLREGDILEANITGKNRTVTFKVAQILKNINGIYVGRTVWRSMGQEYNPSTIYLRSSDSGFVKNKIEEYEFILSAKQKSEIVESIEEQLKTMKVVMTILILFGGVLGCVVLYNLGIMNYFERIRELATLMVLGFYDNEIKTLVLRENTIFTILGIVLGIPLGIRFQAYLVANSETAGFEVDSYISCLSFFIASCITFGFSLLVNLSLGKKFKEIDMIGALKSVE
ncbi:MAG: FtsX-like permease family protein [Firmicutes bacterium ADurb.Bin193]|nr:MAG: FtsX-like permease family protein [Firmicutes bacterium ADurb.Bin193]